MIFFALRRRKVQAVPARDHIYSFSPVRQLPVGHMAGLAVQAHITHARSAPEHTSYIMFGAATPHVHTLHTAARVAVAVVAAEAMSAGNFSLEFSLPFSCLLGAKKANYSTDLLGLA